MQAQQVYTESLQLELTLRDTATHFESTSTDSGMDSLQRVAALPNPKS